MKRFKPVARMMGSRNKTVSCFGNYIAYLLQYKPMMWSMVSKELKGRFKYTTLGYFWHLLNPLSQIIIYYFIFTALFGKDIPNYWVYISTGMFAFVFMNSCISGGCNTIITNKNTVTKMAFAREILIFSKVIINLVTLTISYTILTVLMIFTNVGISLNIFFVPIIVSLMTIFGTGIALLLSSITVYVRDVANAVGIIMGCMLFAVPVIYVSTQMYSTTMDVIWHINPLFYYIEAIHDSLYWGIIPDFFEIAMCAMFAIIFLVIGLCVFKKLERGFAERL